jgi:hypothetical protein
MSPEREDSSLLGPLKKLEVAADAADGLDVFEFLKADD